MPFWSSKAKKKSDNELRSNGSTQDTSSTSPPSPSSLRKQFPVPSDVATKIRLSVLATALVDALGGPNEFKHRFSFPFVNSLLPNDNFDLPPGVWTDDTSMMLCLAHSISTHRETPQAKEFGGFDEVSQMQEYQRWQQDGHLSAVGRCFDIGNTTQRALALFARYPAEEALLRIRSDLGNESNSGNGSLMRILPIGLAYWQDDSVAKSYARRSSQATHPSLICTEVCEMWTGAISLIMQETTEPSNPEFEDQRFSKLSLLEYISTFPYTANKLREALALPFGVPPRPEGRADRERWYFKHHPLLRLITDTQGVVGPRDPKFPYIIPSEDKLPSTGFAVHTAVAALYCFFCTKTFEEGALMAINLGDDADTVGAVYAGLAACWYAAKEGKAEGIFWTKKVREWRKGLVKRNLVEEVGEELVIWEQKASDGYY